jgi:hypothetical protein
MRILIRIRRLVRRLLVNVLVLGLLALCLLLYGLFWFGSVH